MKLPLDEKHSDSLSILIQHSQTSLNKTRAHRETVLDLHTCTSVNVVASRREDAYQERAIGKAYVRVSRISRKTKDLLAEEEQGKWIAVVCHRIPPQDLSSSFSRVRPKRSWALRTARSDIVVAVSSTLYDKSVVEWNKQSRDRTTEWPPVTRLSIREAGEADELTSVFMNHRSCLYSIT